ncbi:MAG TPA: polysaccharide biosynthesis tyrosine autokinase [Clostridia bacterium]|nr:polysaccharide biosynthesis tyrosine autokinase [Clostridia bacterium]
MNKIKRMIRRAQNNPLSKWNTFLNFINKNNRKWRRFRGEQSIKNKEFLKLMQEKIQKNSIKARTQFNKRKSDFAKYITIKKDERIKLEQIRAKERVEKEKIRAKLLEEKAKADAIVKLQIEKQKAKQAKIDEENARIAETIRLQKEKEAEKIRIEKEKENEIIMAEKARIAEIIRLENEKIAEQDRINKEKTDKINWAIKEKARIEKARADEIVRIEKEKQAQIAREEKEKINKIRKAEKEKIKEIYRIEKQKNRIEKEKKNELFRLEKEKQAKQAMIEKAKAAEELRLKKEQENAKISVDRESIIAEKNKINTEVESVLELNRLKEIEKQEKLNSQKEIEQQKKLNRQREIEKQKEIEKERKLAQKQLEILEELRIRTKKEIEKHGVLKEVQFKNKQKEKVQVKIDFEENIIKEKQEINSQQKNQNDKKEKQEINSQFKNESEKKERQQIKYQLKRERAIRNKEFIERKLGNMKNIIDNIKTKFSNLVISIKRKINSRRVLTLDTSMPKEITVEYSPKSYVSESFRTLRTNIQFMNANKSIKTILVTSTMPSEGKSYVSSNLAATFAQANKKVIIVDSDMRKGRMHEIFKIVKQPGLSNYLSGVSSNEDSNELKNYIRETMIDNLYILPMGNTPPNPSELISSEKMITLIKELKEMFDVVIFDGTPSKIVTDSVILSREVDTTLIVTGHNKTKMDDLKKVQKDIENVGGKIAGVVINSVPIDTKKYASSYYYENPEGNRKKIKKMYSL